MAETIRDFLAEAPPADVAGPSNAAPVAAPLAADEFQRRKDLFSKKNVSLGKSWRMRTFVGSFKGSEASVSGSDDNSKARRELYQNLSLRRSKSPRFEPTRFTDQQITEAEESWVPARPKEISKQLRNGATLDSNVPNALAVLRPGSTTVPVSVGAARTGWRADVALLFEVACDEPMIKQLLAAILTDVQVPENLVLEGPTTLAVHLRGPEFQTEVADRVMQLGKVEQSTRANGETVDLDEQVFFTLFDGMLRRGAEGVGAGAQIDGLPLYDSLANANSVAFASTNAPLAQFLNTCMQSDAPRIRDLRMRLALFEVASLNYFENAEIKEATKEFLVGTIIGALGELAIEFIPEINKAANFDGLTYALNVLFGGAVDFIDNYKGRMGAVTMGAADASPAALRQQQRSALMASGCGALYGTLGNFAAQYPIALKQISTAWLIAGTAFSIVGSSLSIPFQMQADRTRKTATVIGLLKSNVAALPENELRQAIAEVGLPPADAEVPSAAEHARLAAELVRQAGGTADVEAQDVPWQRSHVVRQWAAKQVIADMTMSVSSMSSTIGFMVERLLSGFWALNFASKHIRTALQSVIFGISPDAENLSTAGAAVGVAASAHKALDRAAKEAIAMAVKGSDDRVDLDAAAHDRQAGATLGAIRLGVTRGLSAFGNINVLKQRSLL